MAHPAAARYGVIGHPVGHSLSPRIHSAFALQTGEPLSYEALEAPLDGFLACAGDFIQHGGRGLNVTLPFKRAAFEFATRHSPRATRAGAVNTLGFDSEGIWGDNTDGVGLTRDLARLAEEGRPTLCGARVMMIGAGGAAQGVLGPLIDLEPAELILVNRNLARARSLCEQFSGGATLLSARSLESLRDGPLPEVDVVIHATSLSLAGASPDVPDALLARARLVYDLSYAPGPADASTAFLRHARRAGSTHTCDGLGMLVEQAAESFFVWRGVLPDTAPVLQQLRSALAKH